MFITGMVDRPKQSEIDDEPNPKRLKSLQSFQTHLLIYALVNFPNVKKIIYSTCSVYPEENEQVIDKALANLSSVYHLVSLKEMLQNKWINFSSNEYNCKNKCLYSRPNVDLCNGFFVAVFERNFNVPLPVYKSGIQDNVSLINSNMDKPDKKISFKRKKRGKRKKKEEISLNEETSISEDTERGKLSKKRRLEHENVTQINVGEETTRNRDYIESEQKDEKIKLPQKEKGNERLSIDETDRKIRRSK